MTVQNVIIVDDCSSDRTLETAQLIQSRHPDRVLVFHNQENVGSLLARKIGAYKSASDFLVFLDADDTLSAGCIDAALCVALESHADIVAFPIVPEYRPGSTPDPRLAEARREQYDVADAEYLGIDILDAIYCHNRVPWSLVGKLFRRSVVANGFSRLPDLIIFQSEDALMMFAIALESKKMVSSSSIPPYRYVMGVGDTFADQMLTAEQFESICKNHIVAEEIARLCEMPTGGSLYIDVCEHVRAALLNDPCNRFPNAVFPEDRPAAFDALVKTWGIEETVAGLASTHASHPEDVILALDTSRLSPCPSGDNAVGVVYHALGIGGIENKIRQVCSVLHDELGYRVVLLLDDGSEYLDIPSGVDVALLPDCFESVGDYRSRAKALASAIDTFEIGTLVHNQWLGLVAPWDALLAKCLGVSVHMHVHGVYFSAMGYELPDLYYLPLTYAVFDSIVCLSQVDAAFWRRFNSKVLVTVNGLNGVFDNPRAFNMNNRGSHQVIWCGRVDADKGIDDAFCAMRRLLVKVPDASLLVVGPISESFGRDAVDSMIDAYDLRSSVSLLGPLDSERIAELYRSSDVYLLSSLMEGWSISLMEAKACGLPCVMYDLPNLPLCSEGSGVLTVQLGDADGLGCGLTRILTDSSLQKRLSNEAREDAARFLKYPTGEFWRSVVEGGSSPAPVDLRSAASYDAIAWRGFCDMMARKSRLHSSALQRLSAVEADNLLMRQRIDELEVLFSRLKTPWGLMRLLLSRLKRK